MRCVPSTAFDLNDRVTNDGLPAPQSLQLELQNVHKAPGVRLTLGIFSFIRTPLFTGNTNQNKFVFPLLEPETVADSLSKAIYSGYGGTIYMPGIMHVLATMVTTSLDRPCLPWRISFRSADLFV